MSTSKQYPYFGEMDDVVAKASSIVHFTAPETGTVVWSSDPEKIKLGDFSKRWNECFFKPVVDPITIKHLEGALEAVQKAATEPPTYMLVNMEGEVFDSPNQNVEELKEAARLLTPGGYLMWDLFGKEWIGRDRDQNDAMWVVRPMY